MPGISQQVFDNKERTVHMHLRRILAAATTVAAVAVATPAAVAAESSTDTAALSATAAVERTRPIFKMPFKCGQVWKGNAYAGHSPAHSIDWNHYGPSGAPDDYGRDVLASAGGKVLASYYSKTTGYGNTIVIGHGNGWRTRYAHLKTRAVSKGAHVDRGQFIGKVGHSSAIYTLSPHLHYEQIHDGAVVVAHVQGVAWVDGTERNLKSTNRCN